jgi:hypothetical protein
MASPQTPATGTARYHAVAATAEWAAFMAGVAADVVRTKAERERRDAERKRETTYARGVPGRN